MRLSVSIFLYGFLLDALVSVASEWLPALMPLRWIVAFLVFLFGMGLYVLTAFIPRLPKRLILPSALFLVWTNICGGFPLAFVMPDHFQAILEWSQLVLAIGLLALHLYWRRTPPKLDAPKFSWPAFASISILTAVAIPLALSAATINGIGLYIETSSGGYIKLRPQGVLLEEREMSKDGQHVRLVSMVHVGEKDFYDKILASIPAQDTAIVLLEGVTDEKGLLKSRFSYSKIASLLGLSSQEASSFQREGKTAAIEHGAADDRKSKVEYRRADVDISMFQPLTLEFMNAIGVILSDPTVDTFLRTVRATDSPFKQPNADKLVMHDILDRRNEHLVAEIDLALETSQTVIVPWGALHLSYIEAELKKRGFRETSRLSRPAIHFGW